MGLPTVDAAAVAVLVLRTTRGHGPVAAGSRLSRRTVMPPHHFRTGLGWGLVALGAGFAVGWILVDTSAASPTEALIRAPVPPLGWRLVVASATAHSVNNAIPTLGVVFALLLPTCRPGASASPGWGKSGTMAPSPKKGGTGCASLAHR